MFWGILQIWWARNDLPSDITPLRLPLRQAPTFLVVIVPPHPLELHTHASVHEKWINVSSLAFRGDKDGTQRVQLERSLFAQIVALFIRVRRGDTRR